MSEPKAEAKTIFLAALECEGEQALSGFLDQACGTDVALRRRVEELLEANRDAGGFLGGVENPEATFDEPPPASRGMVIGRYKLLEPIGEGGMGMVWMAQQTSPVKRLVAVKLVKAGTDYRQVVARFEAERQALAIMNHPNIAKVFDGGLLEYAPAPRTWERHAATNGPASAVAATPTAIPGSARPYFVMELVKGVPITQYCDEHKLTPRQRLELFMPVCQAIQHAHQKGIIHRDVKPSNVLVARYDDRPVPKIIDFGIAKAIGSQLTDRTLYTGFGTVVGTVQYVSPEQASLNQLDVDTRTDVYSLGVLLYELLTGTTPLERQRVEESGLLEALRIVREEDVPTLSNRLHTTAELATSAANRGMEPRQLTALVRDELNWIVMKALDRDRERRYQSAQELMLDVQRYLAAEPVQAGPPSLLYKARKVLHRHRLVVVAAGLVTLALLGGLAGTTWGMVRAASQRQAAEHNERKALVAAAAEKEAKESALEREAEVQAVLDFVESRIFAAARPRRQAGGLGRNVTVQQAMETAKARIAESFVGQPLIEARLRMTLGLSYAHLGDSKEAEAQCRRARELYAAKLGAQHPLTLSSMHNLAVCYRALGRHSDALRLNEETLALRRACLPSDHPDTLKSMSNLANDYHSLNRHAEAWQLREEVLERHLAQHGPHHRLTFASMNNLAVSYGELNRHEEARALFEKTLKLQEEQLGADHPDLLMTMQNLASCLGDLDQPEAALHLMEKTLQRKHALYGPDHPETLASANNLGAGHAKLGQHGKALELFQGTLQLMKSKHGPDHPLTLGCTWNVAAALVDLGRDDEALPIIDDCVPRALGKDVDPKLFSELLVRRVRIYQRKKDVAGCRDTAEQWEKLKRTDAYGLFVAGRLRAVTATVALGDAREPSAEASRLAQAEADRAMAWLRRAVAARGFEHREPLRSHKDFDVLRDRADFKQLLTELDGDG